MSLYNRNVRLRRTIDNDDLSGQIIQFSRVSLKIITREVNQYVFLPMLTSSLIVMGCVLDKKPIELFGNGWS